MATEKADVVIIGVGAAGDDEREPGLERRALGDGPQHVDGGVGRARRMIWRRKVNEVHDKAETSPRSRRSRS